MERSDSAGASLSAGLEKLRTANDDVQARLARLQIGPSSPVASSSSVAPPPSGAQSAGEPKSKKARAEPSSSARGRDASDQADGWQKVASSRPRPSAGRVGGGQSADDRRTVVVRGFAGSVPREVLPELLEPLLKRLAARFGGRPAAASAVVVLKSEAFVDALLNEFKVEPISVLLMKGADPVERLYQRCQTCGEARPAGR